MIEIIGLLGGLSFSISGVPTAIESIKNGNVKFIPKATQWSIFFGATLMMAYMYIRNALDWVIAFDYTITIISWSIVLKYQYFPRNN